MSKDTLSQRKLEGYLKLAQIIQWGRKNPVRFVERFFGMELLDYQKYAFQMSWNRPYVLWCMGRSSGKALALDTKVPTPTGFTTMGELKVGDFVLDESGKPTRVSYVSEIFIGNDCYEIIFDDGEKIIADADHIWNARTKKAKHFTNQITRDMYVNHKIKRHDGGLENRYRIPKASPIQYEEKELIIDPYLLGYWLGDGSSANTRITCDYDDIKEVMEYIGQSGYKAEMFEAKNRAPYFNVGATPRGQKNEFKSSLLTLNLINNKHIPNAYLYSSVEQRLELLKGLMDSDGTVDKDGYCEFSQKDYLLISQVSQLLSSLGISNKVTKKNAKLNGKIFPTYRIHFSVDKTNSVFKLKRKRDRLKDKLNRRVGTKTIMSMKKVPSVATKCISVDNPTGLFLCGEKFTVTHNTTLGSPFIMAKSLLVPNYQTYILAGVGSQSQEMFMKIEKIAMKEIASFTGLTDVFINELVKSVSNTSGFTHNPQSFQFKLYNGSIVNSLNGSFDNNRSKILLLQLEIIVKKARKKTGKLKIANPSGRLYLKV